MTMMMMMRIMVFVMVWVGSEGYSIPKIVYNSVPMKIYTWSEDWGKKNLHWEASNAGYRAWMAEGYSLVGCKGKDFSEAYLTPCMVKAIVTTAERSLQELGFEVRFKYELKYQDLGNEEIHNLVNRWNPEELDVLFVWNTLSNAQGYTRTQYDMRSTMGVQAGKAQFFQVAHLFRHELTHAMGFNGHLYDPNAFVFRGCGQTVEVKPYALSGLAKSCSHRTFVGSWIPDNGKCGKAYGQPDLYEYRWNVPVYGPIFRAVFQCYLAGTPTVSPEVEACMKILEEPRVKACLEF